MPRVMIIDDDQTMVGLLQSLLRLDGFETVDGAGGEDLLGRTRAAQPDAILMDVYLADKDGLELLGALKADPALTAIPVIMTSGMDMSEECRQLGAEEFLAKPYSPDDLVALLRRLTDPK
jgi:CheY-like chemotaxis protein